MNRTGRARLVLVVALASVSLLTTGLLMLYRFQQRTPSVVSKGDQVPVWYALPPFQLVRHDEAPFTLADMQAGRVSIVNFIFTRCQGPCPRMTSVMAGLQIKLSRLPIWDRLQLVSISVDPDYDTPPVLAQYAGWAHAQEGKWWFVTGPREAVWHLIGEGFKLPVGQATNNPLEPIFHSQKFVLVDGEGRVRGAYDGLESQGLEKMFRDLEALLNQPIER